VLLPSGVVAATLVSFKANQGGGIAGDDRHYGVTGLRRLPRARNWKYKKRSD
jgi:hypothetical protein